MIWSSALDHGRTQKPFRAVVGRFDGTGLVEKHQKLTARPADLGLQVAGQVAVARRGEDGVQLPIQAPAFGG